MPKIAVSRSQKIEKPVAEVFAMVLDFKSWPTWSPWLRADPGASITFEEDSYAWDGEICGSGCMKRIKEVPGESIDFDLSFFKPFKSCAKVRMIFKESGDDCHLTWTMDSSLPFYLFWMRRSMEGFIGMDYERGLLMLKDLMELGEVPSKLTFDGKDSFAGLNGIGIRGECAFSEIEETMSAGVARLRDIVPEGLIFTSYDNWDVVKQRLSYCLSVETGEIPVPLPEGIESSKIPECTVYSLHHTGPFRHLGNAWSGGMMHGRSKQFKHIWRISPFEICEDENDANPTVRICLPCK